MKVLFVSAYPGATLAGGVAAACRNLAEGLAVLGHDVAVISIDEQDAAADEAMRDGVLVHRLPCAHPLRAHRLERTFGFHHDCRSALALVRERLAWQPDIIHGQGLSKEGFVATRLARKLGIPSVVTVHGMIDSEFALDGASALRLRLVRRTMRRVLRSARRVILVSPHRAEEFAGLRRCTPLVIGNAVWPGFYAATPDQTSKTVLHAGVCTGLKRLDTLVASFIRLVQRAPDALLHIVGVTEASDNGSGRAVRGLIEQSGIAARVTLSPPTDREGIRDAMQRARVLALTSEQENAPMIVSEAQAAGVPVVSTAVGGLPWLVHNGKDGYLVETGDIDGHARRLASLLADRVLWERFSAAARLAGKRFRREKVAAETAAVYEAARAGGSEPAS